MDRAEATGLGVSVVGHAALAAAAWFVVTGTVPVVAPASSIEVSYVGEVGLTSASPTPVSEPAPAQVAPDEGPPEEAAPAPEPMPAPEPTPVRPAPPRPAPRPAPAPRAAPAPPRPAPRAQPAPARQTQPSRTARGTGAAQRNAGSLLGPDLLRGIGNDRTARPSRAAPAAQMTGQARANIGQAIQRQVQPCADRQIDPGPGASRITTEISLSLNPDGSLAARPRAGRQSGVDDENRRYAARVADLAIASFVGCAPLRGLPRELYDVPGGWRSFTLRYRLPD